jgi:hypothetical protein
MPCRWRWLSVARPMTPADLLDDLGADTDLARLVRLVRRVCREQLPWVVVSSRAIAGWMQRDPNGWRKVSDWLAAQGIAVVRI